MKGWKKTALAVGIVATTGIVGYVLICKARRPTYPPELMEEFHKMGDVNRDGIINDKDLALLQVAYGSTPGTPNWNPACDLNSDGVVDMRDISIYATNQGLTFEEWLKTKGYRKTHTTQKLPLIKEI